MSIYVKIGKKILKNPNIIRPHVKTKDISELNFKKMKDMGMEKIIFGRYNTFVKEDKEGEINFMSEKIEKSFNRAIDAFGDKNILVIENTMDIEMDEPN